MTKRMKKIQDVSSFFYEVISNNIAVKNISVDIEKNYIMIDGLIDFIASGVISPSINTAP